MVLTLYVSESSFTPKLIENIKELLLTWVITTDMDYIMNSVQFSSVVSDSL